MALFSINIDGVKSESDTLIRVMNSVANIKQKVDYTRCNIDGQILSKRDTNRRLINTSNSLNNIHSQLNEIYRTVNLSADTYLNTENNVNNKGNSQNTGSNIVAFTDFIIKEIPGGIGIVGEIIGTKGAKAAATVVGTVITFGSNTALYEGKYKNEGDPIGKVVVASSVKTGLDVLEDVAITSAVSAAVSAVVVGSAPVSIPVLIISATVLLVIDGISNAATGEDLTEKLADELMLPEENSGNTVNTISNGTKSKLGKVVVPTLSPIPGWQLEK